MDWWQVLDLLLTGCVLMLIVYVRRLLDRFLPPIDSETEGTFDKWVKKKRDEKLGKT